MGPVLIGRVHLPPGFAPLDAVRRCLYAEWYERYYRYALVGGWRLMTWNFDHELPSPHPVSRCVAEGYLDSAALLQLAAEFYGPAEFAADRVSSIDSQEVLYSVRLFRHQGCFIDFTANAPPQFSEFWTQLPVGPVDPS